MQLIPGSGGELQGNNGKKKGDTGEQKKKRYFYPNSGTFLCQIVLSLNFSRGPWGSVDATLGKGKKVKKVMDRKERGKISIERVRGGSRVDEK